MEEKIYKFKYVIHSVKMRIIRISTDGIDLENVEYKRLYYHVDSMDELEEVKWIKGKKRRFLRKPWD